MGITQVICKYDAISMYSFQIVCKEQTNRHDGITKMYSFSLCDKAWVIILEIFCSFYFFSFIWVLTSLSTHWIGHIMMGIILRWRNQYIQLVKVL